MNRTNFPSSRESSAPDGAGNVITLDAYSRREPPSGSAARKPEPPKTRKRKKARHNLINLDRAIRDLERDRPEGAFLVPRKELAGWESAINIAPFEDKLARVLRAEGEPETAADLRAAIWRAIGEFRSLRRRELGDMPYGASCGCVGTLLAIDGLLERLASEGGAA